MLNTLLSFTNILNNLDLILVALFIVFIIIGAIRGMFSQLVGSISTMVALIFATVFCKVLYALVIKLPFFSNNYYNLVFNFATKTFPGLAEVSASDIPNAVSGLPLISAIKSSILNYAESDASLKVNLNVYIAKAVTNYTALAISFLLIFALLKLLFILLKKIGKSLREYNSIKTVDNVLGGIVGAFGLFRRLSFILFVIKIIPFSFLNELKQGIANSIIANFITTHNIVEWILSVLVV